MKSKHEINKKILCERLFNISMNIILEEGIDNFSMNKLASLAGISRTTIYNNFTDKMELIVCIRNYYANRYNLWLSKAISTDKSGYEDLENYYGIIAHALEAEHDIVYVLTIINAYYYHKRTKIEFNRSLSYDVLLEIIKKGHKDKSIVPGDSEQIALITRHSISGFFIELFLSSDFCQNEIERLNYYKLYSSISLKSLKNPSL